MKTTHMASIDSRKGDREAEQTASVHSSKKQTEVRSRLSDGQKSATLITSTTRSRWAFTKNTQDYTQTESFLTVRKAFLLVRSIHSAQKCVTHRAPSDLVSANVCNC